MRDTAKDLSRDLKSIDSRVKICAKNYKEQDGTSEPLTCVVSKDLQHKNLQKTFVYVWRLAPEMLRNRIEQLSL